MGEKKNVPEIRFEGFREPWEEKCFGDIGSVSMCKRVFKDETSESGDIPFYKIGTFGGIPDAYITRALFEEYKAKYPYPEKGDILLSASGTIGRIVEYTGEEAYFQDSNIIWFSHDETVINKFLKILYPQIRWDGIEGSTIKRLYNDNFLRTTFVVPSRIEQEKLGMLFSELDTLLTLQQRKCERLKNIKKSMLEKMFPCEGRDVPEIRFEGFSGAWERKKLGDIMNVTSVKRIHQSDWTDSGVRFLRARDIVAAAKGETPDDLLYISKEKYEEYSLLSGKVAVDDLLVTGVGTIGVPYLIRNSEPLYFKDGNIIWFQNEGRINGDFLYYSFVGKQIQAFIKDSAGIGTVGTYTIDSGKKTPIQLTNSIEQKRIGSYFSHLDHLITLHQQKYEKLKQLKQSLLEKMFV